MHRHTCARTQVYPCPLRHQHALLRTSRWAPLRKRVSVKGGKETRGKGPPLIVGLIALGRAGPFPTHALPGKAGPRWPNPY